MPRQLNEFLVEGLEDYIGLWQLKGASPAGPSYRDDVLQVAQRMIESGWFNVGELNGSGSFVAWPESGPSAVARIKRDWEGSDDPGVFEMLVWFNLTAAGETAAREVASPQDS